MILELIGQLWLLLAALTAFYSLRATYRDWVYNRTIPQEITCQRRSKIKNSSVASEQSEGSSESNTSKKGATWSLGEVALARSQLTARSNRINEHAAESGSKE